MYESTVSARGRVTLPKELRLALGLRPGDRLRFEITATGVRFRPLRSVAELRGMLARPGSPPVSLAEMDEAIAKAAAAEGGGEPG